MGGGGVEGEVGSVVRGDGCWLWGRREEGMVGINWVMVLFFWGGGDLFLVFSFLEFLEVGFLLGVQVWSEGAGFHLGGRVFGGRETWSGGSVGDWGVVFCVSQLEVPHHI